MKRNILGITSILFFTSAALIVRTSLTLAQDSRHPATTTTVRPTEKTVDQVFKNIKVLNGMPQSRLYPAMRFMAASLGFQCGSCHIIRNGVIDAAVDDKPEKQTARQMIKMVIDINNTLFQGNPTVSCYTCHRGQRAPQGVPVLPLPAPAPRPGNSAAASAETVPPSADDILNKYLIAIGGQAAAGRITTCVVQGTTPTAIGQLVAYEAETIAPDKVHETFATQNVDGRCTGDSRCEYERVSNGPQGWLKSGAGVSELAGEQLTDQRLTLPLFEILKLKDQYASFRFFGADKIDNRDVYAISGVRFDARLERLYFDVASGLLRRRISYLRTLVGTIPQQTDFEDYRSVDGLKLPFTITMAFADPGSRPITRKLTEIKLNVPLEESKFDKPR